MKAARSRVRPATPRGATARASSPKGRPGERLRRFADEMGLTARTLGEQLQVSHPTVLAAFEGDASEVVREAVAILTSQWREGPILATDWPKSAHEKLAHEKLARVKPFVRPTGT